MFELIFLELVELIYVDWTKIDQVQSTKWIMRTKLLTQVALAF